MNNVNDVIVLQDVIAQAEEYIQLEQLWPAQDENPDMVIYGGSGELEVLTQNGLSDWMVDTLHKYPEARHVFVSMACTSLCAAILEFSHSSARTAYVFLLEVPKEYLQGLLDTAFGVDEKKIAVCACAGRVILRKISQDKIQENDITVSSCSIFAKPKSLMSDAKLIGKLHDWVVKQKLDDNQLSVVSFSVESEWSDQLMLGFKSWVQSLSEINQLLPSYEYDETHWLAVKPLFELTKYHHHLEQNSLAIVTLGGGGRLSAILLQRGREKTISSTTWTPPQPLVMDSVNLKNNTILKRTEKPRYCDVNYRHDDAYFFSEVVYSA